MFTITGKYNSAKVFTQSLDDKSREQIQTLCDQEFTTDSQIRLMPDVHAGIGCTIGTTMTIADKVVPNLVGVDIGCGMETVMISCDTPVARSFVPETLDKLIYKHIPRGIGIRETEHEYVERVCFEDMRYTRFNLGRARKSIGTLGGGNHFIEACYDDAKNLYIVIHSGSRNFGHQIAEYYQKEAVKGLDKDSKVPRTLAYLMGDLYDDYLQDMKLTVEYANQNRLAMMSVILAKLGVSKSDIVEQWTTVHNYIDTKDMILRKGAVSAKKGEKLLIPINMRDGSLICEGLGNSDWNFSAPHGAGRLMSRTKAFETLDMNDFKDSMSGIYSTSVNKNTLDESPMCYKDINEIIENIQPTAKVLKKIKPVYNFKAAEK